MVNGAVFIDFENIYLSIKKDICIPPHTPRPVDIATALLSALKKMLRDKGVSLVIGRSFSDWDYSDTREALHSLAMMGFEPQYLTAKPNKNSADLVLSLQAMEILLMRDDIEHFVIVGGDRDYIPIVRRIKERAKAVTVVGFRQNTSGDLKEIVGPDNFLDAATLLPQLMQMTQYVQREAPQPMQAPAPPPAAGVATGPQAPLAAGLAAAQTALSAAAAASTTNGNAGSLAATSPGPAVNANASPAAPATSGAAAPEPASTNGAGPAAVPAPTTTAAAAQAGACATVSPPAPGTAPAGAPAAGLPGMPASGEGPRPPSDTTIYRRSHMNIENLERCVELLVRAQETHRNELIWLAPFFRNYMNEAFFQYSNEQRKELIATLQQMGAIAIKSMEGDSGFTYSVVELRADHPMVAKKMTSRSFRSVTRFETRGDRVGEAGRMPDPGRVPGPADALASPPGVQAAPALSAAGAAPLAPGSAPTGTAATTNGNGAAAGPGPGAPAGSPAADTAAPTATAAAPPTAPMASPAAPPQPAAPALPAELAPTAARPNDPPSLPLAPAQPVAVTVPLDAPSAAAGSAPRATGAQPPAP
ncbi:MAG: NYN domain-containing protein [Planctomycetes bacterium]|nr:NYN domain-containing protein [Planctomycetota bacterium]